MLSTWTRGACCTASPASRTPKALAMSPLPMCWRWPAPVTVRSGSIEGRLSNQSRPWRSARMRTTSGSIHGHTSSSWGMAAVPSPPSIPHPHRLRARSKLDRALNRCGCGIDGGEGTAAIPHDELVCPWMDPDVVRILAERHGRDWFESLPSIEPDRTVTGAGHRQHIGSGLIAKALGVLEAGDAVQHAPRVQVDSIHGAVAELGDEQALAREVDRHVVDPARHRLEGD